MSTDEDKTRSTRSTMDRDRDELLAEMAAARAVRRVFLTLGVDLENSESMREWQADLAWLRQKRERSQNFNWLTTALASAMTLCMGFGLTMAIYYFHGGGPHP